MEYLLNIVYTILYSCGTIILLFIGGGIVVGIKYLCKKLGIEITDKQFSRIITIIKQVISYIDQVFVDTIKKNSGTLTDYQKELVMEAALDNAKALLSSDQIKLLLEKYQIDDVDTILKFLIESMIAETRASIKPTEGDTVIINNDIPNDVLDSGVVSTCDAMSVPTDEEINSLELCGGDCETCSLSSLCTICRIQK